MVQTFERSNKGMKTLFGQFKFSWFIAFCLAAIMAIVACNLWSLYWGHCVLMDFLRIPAIGWALIGANLVAGVTLLTIKRSNRKKHEEAMCGSCHTGLQDTWAYCPNCGDEHSA